MGVLFLTEQERKAADLQREVRSVKDYRFSMRGIIRKELRWRVRDLLDQMNISERIVYTGLDGLSSWLVRHYFVKENPAAKINRL